MTPPRRRRPAPSPRAPRAVDAAAPPPTQALALPADDVPPSTRAHWSLMARVAPSFFPEAPAPSADAASSELSPKERARAEVHVVADWLVDCCAELDRLCREAFDEPERSPVGDPAILGRVAKDLSGKATLLSTLAHDSEPSDTVVTLETSHDGPTLPRLRRVWDRGLERYRFVDVPPQLALIAEEIERQCAENIDSGFVTFRWQELPEILADFC